MRGSSDGTLPVRRGQFDSAPAHDVSFARRHLPLATPGLFKLVRCHVGDRIVIVAEDRGVEVLVLGISADDRTAGRLFTMVATSFPIGFNSSMYRRRFLAVVGGLLVAPRPLLASPAVAPLRRLRLFNAHTRETFDGPFRDDMGPIAVALAELSDFLRDHYSGEKTAIDVAVLDFLLGIMDAVGATQATILSAYRTRETNAMLVRTHFGVAENSQHIYGRALDIRLDTRAEGAVQAARAMQRGGVGWYPHSGFFHIDTGPVRNWTLDEGGLDSLLINRRKEMAITRRNHLVLPGMEQGGDPLPRLANSGRPLPGLAQSGTPLPGFEQSGHRISRLTRAADGPQR